MPAESIKDTAEMSAIETPVLAVSDSLVLRPAELDDAESFLKLVADDYDRLTEWLAILAPPSTAEERRTRMAKDLEPVAAGTRRWWMIESNGELAGTIDIHGIHYASRWGLIGYWLADGFTGRGIMTESVRTVIDWAFTRLGLNTLETLVAVANRQSCIVPERLGIRRESIRRKSDQINGVAHDMASYVAFKDNWPPKPPEKPMPARLIQVDNEIIQRPFEERDREPLWQSISTQREYLEKFLPWVIGLKTKDDHNKNFTTRRQEVDVFDRSANYAIEYRGEFVGGTGFELSASDNNMEIGYWLREDMQSRGIMTRCVTALINMGVVEMGIHRVAIRAATANLPSRGIPERLGFVHEGTMRGAGLVNGEYLDLELYSILDHEWLARSNNA